MSYQLLHLTPFQFLFHTYSSPKQILNMAFEVIRLLYESSMNIPSCISIWLLSVCCFKFTPIKSQYGKFSLIQIDLPYKFGLYPAETIVILYVSLNSPSLLKKAIEGRIQKEIHNGECEKFSSIND